MWCESVMVDWWRLWNRRRVEKSKNRLREAIKNYRPVSFARTNDLVTWFSNRDSKRLINPPSNILLLESGAAKSGVDLGRVENRVIRVEVGEQQASASQRDMRASSLLEDVSPCRLSLRSFLSPLPLPLRVIAPANERICPLCHG